jgi:YgiT-type zinc finger domain-containing protein
VVGRLQAAEIDEMSVSLSKCMRCGSVDLEDREVEKLVRGGDDVAALRVQATVCHHCGERYLPSEAVRALEEARRSSRRQGEPLSPLGPRPRPVAGQSRLSVSEVAAGEAVVDEFPRAVNRDECRASAANARSVRADASRGIHSTPRPRPARKRRLLRGPGVDTDAGTTHFEIREAVCARRCRRRCLPPRPPQRGGSSSRWE